MPFLHRLLLCSLLLLNGWSHASEDLWPDDEDVDSVSDGELRFLETPPEKPVHHHFNQIGVTEQSLLDGWVSLRQCHFNLDPVHALEITYRPAGIRKLEILSSQNVGSARVQGASIQLSDIQQQGKICIQAESRALHAEGTGYLLQNGPYMRRFLDGYYPMQITLELSLPETLKVVKVNPGQTTGVEVENTGSTARISGWFEGILYTRIWICRRSDPTCLE